MAPRAATHPRLRRALLALELNGSTDDTFGTNGVVKLCGAHFGNFGTSDNVIADSGLPQVFGLQSSGKVVVAGTVEFKSTQTTTKGFGVLRLWP